MVQTEKMVQRVNLVRLVLLEIRVPKDSKDLLDPWDR